MTTAPGAEPDLIVIGGGPAGVGAATEAAAHGLRVMLVDEADQAGGEVYRVSVPGLLHSYGSAETRRGDAQRAALRRAVDMRLAETVWSVAGAFRVDTIAADGPHRYEAQAVIVATGTQERVIPFPGWTTPGVIGLAATTTLLKSQGMLPGQRVLVAGCGPLLASVAAGILGLGGDVAAVVDLAARGDWIRCLPALASRPAELARGILWLARLRRAGVSVLHRMAVTEVVSDATGLRAAVACVDGEGRVVQGSPVRRFDVDAVVVGHGLVPATDITRLMRVDHAYDAVGGSWRPVLDPDGRTSLPGLLVAGGAAGLAGAGSAYLGGRIAGLAAARDMGRMSAATHARLAAPLRRKVGSAARLGGAMAAMMAPRRGLADAIAADTVVCRCEDVTRAEIDAAVLSGAASLNQLKAWTRCGMGPCQGRMCADTAAALLSAHGIARQDAGQFTGRTPLRPVPLDLLTGDYDYADIVLPPPAPP